jgi:hypothetical protein
MDENEFIKNKIDDDNSTWRLYHDEDLIDVGVIMPFDYDIGLSLKFSYTRENGIINPASKKVIALNNIPDLESVWKVELFSNKINQKSVIERYNFVIEKIYENPYNIVKNYTLEFGNRTYNDLILKNFAIKSSVKEDDNLIELVVTYKLESTSLLTESQIKNFSNQ